MALLTKAALLSALVIASQACMNDFDALELSSAGAGAATSASGSATGASGGVSQGGSASSSISAGGAGNTGAAEGGAGNTGGEPPVGGAGPGSGGAGGEPPLASCIEQYGDAPSFAPCVETEVVCEFFTIFAGSTSCSAFCAARGGKCNTVYNQGPAGNRCTYDTVTQYDCAGNWNNMICVCTHGCGGEPACTGGTQCDGTSCI